MKLEDRVKCQEKRYQDHDGRECYGRVGTVVGFWMGDVLVEFGGNVKAQLPPDSLRVVTQRSKPEDTRPIGAQIAERQKRRKR